MVEFSDGTLLMVDRDPAGDHLWVVFDHAEPNRIGTRTRRPVTPDCRVVDHRPDLALAARCQGVDR